MSHRDTTTPGQARRLTNQGAALLEKGKAQEALPFLERAYEIDAQSVALLVNLGAAYVLVGRHKDAIPLLESARDFEPHNPMVWVNLGAAYLGNPVLASGEMQMRAISAFQKALELNPTAPNVHYNLGLIFVDRGEPGLAMAAFRQATQVNPKDRDAQQWLHKLDAGGEGGQERGT